MTTTRSAAIQIKQCAHANLFRRALSFFSVMEVMTTHHYKENWRNTELITILMGCWSANAQILWSLQRLRDRIQSPAWRKQEVHGFMDEITANSNFVPPCDWQAVLLLGGRYLDAILCHVLFCIVEFLDCWHMIIWPVQCEISGSYSCPRRFPRNSCNPIIGQSLTSKLTLLLTLAIVFSLVVWCSK